MAKQALAELELSPTQIEAYYREMCFIRAFEDKSLLAFRSGKAGGYLHVYSGMEAIAQGWLHNLKKGYDYVITAYRDHAHALVLGSDPLACMAEIMGRKTGLSKGKGGSMHLYDIEKGFFGGWGIVGAHTALGGGLALAAKYRGEDRVTLCFLGDGAANAGVFFETLNMAGLWKLPIVFIVENNLYAMGTALERHAADIELHKRGYPFAMEHERLEGWDFIQAYKDARRIIDQVRREQKPYFVEIMAYRLSGHGAADHDRQLYRTKKEEDFWAKERDPLKRLARFLVEKKFATEEKLEAIEEEERERAEQIYAAALEAPFPEPHEVYEDVYTDLTPEEGH